MIMTLENSPLKSYDFVKQIEELIYGQKKHDSWRGVFEDRFGDIKHRITINNVRYDPIPNSEKCV